MITLEPDPDVGDFDAGDLDLPAIDAWIADAGEMPPIDFALPVDADLPQMPVLIPPALDFGEVDPLARSQLSVSLVAGTDGVRINRIDLIGVGFDLGPRAPRAPIELTPGERVRWTVVFSPPVVGDPLAGALVIRTDIGDYEVPLTGIGGWAGIVCTPWRVQATPGAPDFVRPGTPLALKASPPIKVAANKVRLRWRTLEGPPGRAGDPFEIFANPEQPFRGGAPDDVSTLGSVFYADKAGRYVFEAQPILPPEAQCQPEPTRVVVHACPCADRPLHVRIGWQRSAGAPPGNARVVPVLANSAARNWDDAATPGRSVDWLPPGDEGDLRIDVEGDETAGRIDMWLDDDPLDLHYRLGLGVFHDPGRPATRVDLFVEIAIGDDTVLAMERRHVQTGRTFWDALALVTVDDAVKPVAYDRLLTADPSRWPAFNTPLAEDSACHAGMSPQCGPGLHCLSGDAGWRCRR